MISHVKAGCCLDTFVTSHHAMVVEEGLYSEEQNKSSKNHVAFKYI